MIRPYFRPLPYPTLWCLPAIALLIALGFWQVERLHWKEALIAQVSRNLSAPPITLSQALSLPSEQSEYRQVVVIGRFDHAKENYSYAIDAASQPVLHVLTPLLLQDGHAVIVDRGEVPFELKDPAKRKAGQLLGVQRLVGVWHMPSLPNLFTPGPNTKARLWFVRDVRAMAKLDRLRLAAPVVIEAGTTPNPGGWPKGGQTVVDFPNNHLQYALTWFGLAAALFSVYLVYHRAQGRLGFR